MIEKSITNQTKILNVLSLHWILKLFLFHRIFIYVSGSRNLKNLNQYSHFLLHFFVVRQTQWTQASSLSRFQYHIWTHHTRQDSSGQVIGPLQIRLLYSTQHSQQKKIHTAGGIRTRNHKNEWPQTFALYPLLRIWICISMQIL